MEMNFIKNGPWSDAEQKLASRYGLTVYPANEKIIDLLGQELDMSDFSQNDIQDEFNNHCQRLMEFSLQWYTDCKKNEYDEDWNTQALAAGRGVDKITVNIKLITNEGPQERIETFSATIFPGVTGK